MPRIATILSTLLLMFPLAALAQDPDPQDTIPQDSTFLTLVDTVKAGDQIVIERNGAVLYEQVPKNGIITATESFVTTNLTGEELYVWTLLQGLKGLYLGGQGNFWLNNTSGANFTLDYNAPQTQWIFEFAEDSTATIVSTANRFIGETGAYTYQFKTYTKNNTYLSAYGHEFRIYRLDRPVPPDPEPTGTEEIDSSSLQGGDRCRLILHSGQLLITRDGKTYSLLGTRIE